MYGPATLLIVNSLLILFCTMSECVSVDFKVFAIEGQRGPS